MCGTCGAGPREDPPHPVVEWAYGKDLSSADILAKALAGGPVAGSPTPRVPCPDGQTAPPETVGEVRGSPHWYCK